MKKYLVTYIAPARVLEEWKNTPEADRKAAEVKMQNDWKEWMSAHAKIFTDPGAGVGKTKRVTAKGVADIKNDIMLYAIVEAESHEAAAEMFKNHPHFGIPEASIEIMAINALPGMSKM